MRRVKNAFLTVSAERKGSDPIIFCAPDESERTASSRSARFQAPNVNISKSTLCSFITARMRYVDVTM